MDSVALPGNAVSPGVVVTDSNHKNDGYGYGYGGYNQYDRGLSGKDAAFINELATLETLRDLTSEVHQNAKSTDVAVERNGRSAELATEKTAAAVNVALVQGFKDSRYDAAVNTAAVQAAIAACCCEVKELVRAQAADTQLLIRTIESDRVRDQLATANSEITMLKLKLALPAIPV